MAIQSLGIDVREASQQGAGKARYTLELTKALIQKAPASLHFYLFTKTPNKAFQNSENVTQVILKGKGPLWHFKLRRYLKRSPIDFFLAPTSFIYAAIAPREQKVAIVIHDLIAFLHRKGHAWFPTLVERLTLKRALHHSRFLICVSQNTAKDLAKLFPEAHQKTVLIAPPAASSSVQRIDSQKMDLPKDYLLGVGTLSPRKNLQLLFKAFAKIAEKHPHLHIVLAGGKGWKGKEINEALPSAYKDRIHFLGYVNDMELNELYSRAQMLIFPSLYEGFGMPPLEAMAVRCPVITSNAASLPEVVGNAALQIDPHNADALASAIEELLKPEVHMDYQKKGLIQARFFSWEKSAEQILKALQSD